MAIFVKKTLRTSALVLLAITYCLRAYADDTVLRTPWGIPDLNGVWKFGSATPLERSDELADRSHFTAEEAVAYVANGVARLDEVGRSFDDNYVGAELWVPTDTPLTTDLRTSLIYEPANGKIPYTPEGLAHLQAGGHSGLPAGPEDRPPYERCIIGFNVGPPMETIVEYNDFVQIFQTRDTVVLLHEMVNDARIIPLDGRAPLPDRIRQWRGDSRGYWDGDTLVVQTRNFTDHTSFRGSGRNMLLTERFTRIDDDILEYGFRIDDPQHFESSWAARTELRKSKGPLYEYACHEHNRSMEYMLSGARAQEARGEMSVESQ